MKEIKDLEGHLEFEEHKLQRIKELSTQETDWYSKSKIKPAHLEFGFFACNTLNCVSLLTLCDYRLINVLDQ